MNCALECFVRVVLAVHQGFGTFVYPIYTLLHRMGRYNSCGVFEMLKNGRVFE